VCCSIVYVPPWSPLSTQLLVVYCVPYSQLFYLNTVYCLLPLLPLGTGFGFAMAYLAVTAFTLVWKSASKV